MTTLLVVLLIVAALAGAWYFVRAPKPGSAPAGGITTASVGGAPLPKGATAADNFASGADVVTVGGRTFLRTPDGAYALAPGQPGYGVLPSTGAFGIDFRGR